MWRWVLKIIKWVLIDWVLTAIWDWVKQWF
mgnify:FL=1